MKKIILLAISGCFLVVLIGFGTFQKYHGECEKEFVNSYYFPAMRLAELGMDVRVEYDNINIKNGNVF